MSTTGAISPAVRLVEKIGRATAQAIEGIGHGASLLAGSLYWACFGWRRKQPVRLPAVISEMMDIGIFAIPIVTVLSAAIGTMLAIQGIHTLRMFGAESRVVIGISLSVVREFAPLITGILIAGRSGSALAARLGTMQINQEIDALTSMGINPVRFLVAPSLLAMLVMLPALTFFSDVVALFAAGLYVNLDLGLSLTAYADQALEILSVDDLIHGLGKSILFAFLITLVAVVNGAAITGGAEGVGRVTTRSVVHAITAIVITDMLFAFLVTR
ncbi:MAG: MlaE family ABC transporter permease [Mariprofundaceae bacterium]